MENEETGIAKKNTKKVSTIIWTIIGALILVSGIFLFIFARDIFGDEIADSILGPGVPNGLVAIGNFFNDNAWRLIFSLTVISGLFLVSFVLMLLINLVLRKSARARTIGSLTKSLIKYLFVVLGICIVLGVWGVNVYGIFAGLGVLGLVIGLGCKTLVNDIISGFFIVVDNYFQVGDKVIIDGFTGFVETIGLRTTKIKSWDGNLKAINNSLITTVVNLSKYPSKVVVRIDVSFNEDLRRVEAIILENLPRISQNVPELKSQITYEGVDGLDECGVTLLFFADVDEIDLPPATRKTTRELYLLLSENDIIIPFRQLVVNEPDPIGRKRASKEELEISNDHFYAKPIKKETKKKAKFKEAFAKALKNTQLDLDDH